METYGAECDNLQIECKFGGEVAMNGSKLHSPTNSYDPTTSDIPHSVDLQAVVDILNKFYPHLDTEEIKRRLLQVMHGQGRILFVPSEEPIS